MSEQAILYEQVDSIAKIWMNRPNQGNRISRKLFLELDSAMTKAIADPSVRQRGKTSVAALMLVIPMQV